MGVRTTELPPGLHRFLLGVRFFPYDGGPLFWADRDPGPAARAVADAAGCGFGALRLALPIAQFMPAPHRVDEAAVARFGEVLQLAADAGLRVVTSILAGPTAAPEAADAEGWAGRPPGELVADPTFVFTAVALARALASSAAGGRALVAWEVARGLPRWGGGAPPSALRALFKAVRDALLETATEQAGIGPEGGESALPPVSPGDGLLATTIEEPGLAPEAVVADAELLTAVIEPTEHDALRHAYHVGWTCARLRPLGRPFVLSEVGSPRTFAADDAAAAELREAVLAAMLDGACGAFYRGLSDVPPTSPAGLALDRSPHDLYSGALTHDGTARGVALEVRSIADGLAAHGIELERLRLPPATAAVLVPDELAGGPGDPTPGLAAGRRSPGDVERAESARVLREAFVLLRTTGSVCDVVTETTLAGALAEGYRLIVAPLGHRHRASTWRRLLELARGGVRVYVPWSPGYDWRAAGFAGIDFRDLTGCRHRLRPGYPQAAPGKLRLEFDGGRLECEIPRGAEADLPISQCPVAPEEAATLGKVDGRVALVGHEVGKGEVIFSSFPWERILVRHARSRSRAGGPVFYRTLARRAGIEPWVSSENSRVEVRAFRVARDDATNDLFILATNHGYGTERARIRLDVARATEAAGVGVEPLDPETTVAREVWPERGEEHHVDQIDVSLKRKEIRLLRCVSGQKPPPPRRRRSPSPSPEETQVG